MKSYGILNQFNVGNALVNIFRDIDKVYGKSVINRLYYGFNVLKDKDGYVLNISVTFHKVYSTPDYDIPGEKVDKIYRVDRKGNIKAWAIYIGLGGDIHDN